MLYSLATMFRRRCWLGALCLVLAAMLPTYVLGSQMLSNPSSLPVFETLSISASPILYPSSPPILAFIPTPIMDRTREFAVWVGNTKKVVSRSFNKPPFMYSRLAFRAYRAISASLSGRRRPLPPPATCTSGESPSPTRTRTTSTDHPALPEPAYAQARKRAYRPALKSYLSPGVGLASRRQLYTILYPYRLQAQRSVMRRESYAANKTPLPIAILHLATNLLAVSMAFISAIRHLPFAMLGSSGFLVSVKQRLSKKRVLHYRYRLQIIGYLGSTVYLRQRHSLTSEGPRREWEFMEWGLWATVDSLVSRVKMEHSHVPDLDIQVRVTRERKVYDCYETASGEDKVEVPQDDYHGPEVFESEGELMLVTPTLDLNLEQRVWEVGIRWQGLTRPLPPSPPSSPLLTPPPSPMLQGPNPGDEIPLPPVRVIEPGDLDEIEDML